MKDTNNKQGLKKSSQAPKKQIERIGFDWLRIVLGIIILCVLLCVALHMINGAFAEKQDELIEEKEDDFGWIVIAFGYTVPLILACTIPVVMCLGSKKSAQRKHLIKALIIAGALGFVFLIVCPVQITVLTLQREFCEMMEDKEAEEDDFIYPADLPSVDDVTLKLQRTVEWTAKGGLGLAIVGAYQGVRYKKLRDGDEDDEIPEDELSDDLPDVDWTPSKKESKKI